jgi:hypothetical protein
VVGASGRAMLEVRIKGETDPVKLAELAKGTLGANLDAGAAIAPHQCL